MKKKMSTKKKVGVGVAAVCVMAALASGGGDCPKTSLKQLG